MGTREFWTFVNSFAEWFSAIGTIAAVITALYLARREGRPAVRVRAGMRTLIASGLPRQEFVMLDVTNLGRREVRLTHLYWTTGILRKQHYVWLAPRNALSSAFPIKLEDGEQANYMMPAEELEEKFANIARRLSGRWAPIRARMIRTAVATSSGHDFSRRVEPSLWKPILQLCRRLERQASESDVVPS